MIIQIETCGIKAIEAFSSVPDQFWFWFRKIFWH